MIKLFTTIGTRLRLEPNMNSVVIKTYVEKVELKMEKKEERNDGIWFLVKDEKENKTGWVRYDLINKYNF